MNSGSPRRGRPMADINVTPLVDILLVLLVAFIVVADVLGAPREGLPLELPRAGSGGVLTDAPVRVSLTESGQVGIDGQPVDRTALVAKIKELLAKKPQAGEVIIAADGNVRQSEFVAILDLLNQAGATGVTIETVPSGP